MLFSSQEIADFINERFEPVWQSLRPVPRVTIDFQNGHVIRRTLQGNVATFICAPTGQVADILPGIYSAAGYLEQLTKLAEALRPLTEPHTNLATFISDYFRGDTLSRLRSGVSEEPNAGAQHFGVSVLGRGLYAALTGMMKRTKDTEPPDMALRAMSKAATQAPLKAAINPTYNRPAYESTVPPQSVRTLSSQETSQWEALIADTLVNERLRKERIHKYLRSLGAVQPGAVTRWLYREVLDADLDDPYLGLGKQLFDTYPFEN